MFAEQEMQSAMEQLFAWPVSQVDPVMTFDGDDDADGEGWDNTAALDDEHEGDAALEAEARQEIEALLDSIAEESDAAIEQEESVF